MRWQASNLYGWGILGLNLFQQWAADPDVQPLLAFPVKPSDLPCVDPLRLLSMSHAAEASNSFLDELAAGRVNLRKQAAVVVDALGNGLMPPMPRLSGIRTLGRCIFENTRLETTQQLAEYDGLICASRWAATLLSSLSDRPVTMIHEGIDPSLFFPGPRSGLLNPDRFYVFSGGKVEFRKAHDLVILAFREFAARHDDAVLVAAWSSPWPGISAGFQGKLRAPLHCSAQGVLDFQRWIVENGVQPSQFIELPAIPNHLMPGVLREMDCSLQVSRCEACTNLPAKEAMACGVPVILANNTGARDLVGEDNCLALNSQDAVAPQPGLGTDGWGETSVEQIVDALESLYTDTQRRKHIATRGASWVLENQRTWSAHAAALKSHLLGLL